MYYQNLNEVSGNNKTGNQLGDGGVTLNNIQSDYWSGTGFASNPFGAWVFLFFDGEQFLGSTSNNFYGWAVRPGDSVAAVPEVGSGLLMGLGLLGMRLARW